MDMTELLEKAKEHARIPSDYALAKAMNIDRSIISQWKGGKRHPSNEEAVQLATLAGLDEMQVIAEIELRTAKNEKKQLFWKNYLESRGVTACLTMTALALAIVITPQSSEAIVLHNKNYDVKKEALSPVFPHVQQIHLLYIMRI